MQKQNSIGQQDNSLNENEEQTYKDEDSRLKLNDPVMNKIYSEFYRNKYNSIAIQNTKLKLENRNLVLENERLKQELSCFNNLMLQFEQQEKYIDAIQIQTIQNQHLCDANTRHVQEICRYIQLLEYKQQHIQQLDLQLKEASEKYKFNINEQDFIIPDQIQNKSHITSDDKYYIDQEYQIQKEQLEKKIRRIQKIKRENQSEIIESSYYIQY